MKRKFQHHLMICLALVDLLTVPAQTPALVALWNDGILLTDVLCNLTSILCQTTLAATTWLHVAICIEKCYSILWPLRHKLFLTQYRSSFVALKITLVELCVILTLMTVLTFTGNLHSHFIPTIALCAYTINLVYLLAFGTPYVVLVTHTLMLREVKKSCTHRWRRLLRGLKTVALTVCIYYTCWVPFLVFVILKSLFSLLDDVSPKIVAYCFVLSNSAMNFFIYIHCMNVFREQFKVLFCSRNRRRVRCYASDPTESRDIRMKSIKTIDLHSNYRWVTRNNPIIELYTSHRG